MYLQLVPHLNQTNPGEVDIKLFFVPQPWHPQSGTLTEGALSVQKEKQEATVRNLVKTWRILLAEKRIRMWRNTQVQFIERLYDQREHFTDDKLYDSSRRDIYHKLVDIAERKAFLPWDWSFEPLNLSSGSWTMHWCRGRSQQRRFPQEFGTDGGGYFCNSGPKILCQVSCAGLGQKQFVIVGCWEYLQVSSYE